MGLVELEGGLIITPKHPVLIKGVWYKPKELGEIQVRKCKSVFNFILDGGHTMDINGVACSTFGHGFKGEKVEHEYFGSQKIV